MRNDSDSASSGSDPNGVSRRSFIKTFGASAALSSLAGAADKRGAALAQAPDGPPILGPDPVPVSFTVNGKQTQLRVDPATTLLQALRLDLNLTGSKEICDRGSCGGCSVLIDGRLMNSCMTLALDAAGSQITTIEGLAKDGALDPVQEALVRHDALQCGYCTPGLVVACRALLNENPKPTLPQIKHALGGNICRCGTYTNVFNAVLDASGQRPVMDQGGA